MELIGIVISMLGLVAIGVCLGVGFFHQKIWKEGYDAGYKLGKQHGFIDGKKAAALEKIRRRSSKPSHRDRSLSGHL